MTDAFVLLLLGVCFAGTILALCTARHACTEADRIRRSTESVDRLEMRIMLAEHDRRKAAKTLLGQPRPLGVFEADGPVRFVPFEKAAASDLGGCNHALRSPGWHA